MQGDAATVPGEVVGRISTLLRGEGPEDVFVHVARTLVEAADLMDEAELTVLPSGGARVREHMGPCFYKSFEAAGLRFDVLELERRGEALWLRVRPADLDRLSAAPAPGHPADHAAWH